MFSEPFIDFTLEHERLWSQRWKATDYLSDVVDIDVLNSLESSQTDQDPDRIIELIDWYLSDAPCRIAAMRDSLGDRDARALMQSAHRLRGNSASLGALYISALCGEIEQMAQQHSFCRADLLLNRLEDGFAAARQVFMAERQKRCG